MGSARPWCQRSRMISVYSEFEADQSAPRSSTRMSLINIDGLLLGRDAFCRRNAKDGVDFLILDESSIDLILLL